jgi:phage gpG-like protein
VPPVLFITDFGSAIAEAERLEGMAANALDTELPMIEIAGDMLRTTEIVFTSRGKRGGGSWKKLSPNTVRRWGPHPILELTSTLRDSVTVPGAPYQILEVSNDFIEFGTEVESAGFQQEGTRKMPARPFLRFIPADFTRWNNILVRHLIKSHAR